MQPVPRADTLTTFICRMSKNSGSLNLLQPSGPVQACRGIALPLRKEFAFVGLYVGEHNMFLTEYAQSGSQTLTLGTLVVRGFHSHETSLLLGYETASQGICFPTFRDSYVVSTTKVERSKNP